MIATDLLKLDLFNGAGRFYFSCYVEAAAMQKTTKSLEVIRVLKAIFAQHGNNGTHL